MELSQILTAIVVAYGSSVLLQKFKENKLFPFLDGAGTKAKTVISVIVAFLASLGINVTISPETATIGVIAQFGALLTSGAWETLFQTGYQWVLQEIAYRFGGVKASTKE